MPAQSEDDLHNQIIQMPAVRSLFQDEEELIHFLESLDPHEMRIIIEQPDPKVVIQIKKQVDDDLNATAKDLAMED